METQFKRIPIFIEKHIESTQFLLHFFFLFHPFFFCCCLLFYFSSHLFISSLFVLLCAEMHFLPLATTAACLLPAVAVTNHFKISIRLNYPSMYRERSEKKKAKEGTKKQRRTDEIHGARQRQHYNCILYICFYSFIDYITNKI